ncbi:MAG: PEP-CTERM sorting domain-containing protein [Candidatus Omnitrophota bacterium]
MKVHRLCMITILFLFLFASVATQAFARNWKYDWSIAASEDGVGYGGVLQQYNQIDIWSKSGDAFDNPVFTNYTAGWTAMQDSLASAYLVGAATEDTTYFTLNFYGKKESAQLLYMTALDNTVTGRWLADVTSTSITTRELTACEWASMGGGSPIVTPEPVSSALFIIGGIGLFCFRRRITQKAGI